MNAPRNTPYRHIEAHRIAGSLGAEITGVDLSRDLPAEVTHEINAALLANQVIFFRDQNLSPENQLDFARKWGALHQHPFMKGMDAYPDILEIRKTPADKKNFGGSWHSDQMFMDKPALGTILYAKEVPSVGGDTMWANLYLAYEALSDGMKAMLSDLRGISVGDHFKGHDGKSRKEFYADKISMQVRDPGDIQTTNAHPLVRTHPETGRRALYVGGHVQGIEGWHPDESQPLLDFLMRHSVKPEFTCRFRWETGSLAFWDNRCTQHYAINDYPSETRVMHRITVSGDTPY